MMAQLLDDNTHFLTAKLTLQPGDKHEAEVGDGVHKTYICLRGAGVSRVTNFPKTLLQGNFRALKPGVSIEVPGGARFSLENNTEGRLILLEVTLYV